MKSRPKGHETKTPWHHGGPKCFFEHDNGDSEFGVFFAGLSVTSLAGGWFCARAIHLPQKDLLAGGDCNIRAKKAYYKTTQNTLLDCACQRKENDISLPKHNQPTRFICPCLSLDLSTCAHQNCTIYVPAFFQFAVFRPITCMLKLIWGVFWKYRCIYGSCVSLSPVHRDFLARPSLVSCPISPIASTPPLRIVFTQVSLIS